MLFDIYDEVRLPFDTGLVITSGTFGAAFVRVRDMYLSFSPMLMGSISSSASIAFEK